MMADYMIYLDWTLAPHSHSIDIPARYRHSEDYSASLAHKVVDDILQKIFEPVEKYLQANHSFQPNCCFGRVQHPVFGLTCLGVKTLKAVARGEEIFVNYRYSPAHAPAWYTDIINNS